MTTEAKILAHSRGPSGQEVVTFQLRFPRFILPELATHRVFSKNSASTRAIPTAKLAQRVRETPFVPAQFAMNVAGMQAGEALSPEAQREAEAIWREAAAAAADFAARLAALGVHKQWAGRVIEPYLFVSVVLTSTIEGLANFWHLRDHPDAQPEIQELARMMRDAYDASTPRLLGLGQWHLPYITAEDFGRGLGMDVLRRVSAARCCRVSYNRHDGAPASIEEDLALCERLVGSKPLHASPFEHACTPDQWAPAPMFTDGGLWCYPPLHGNLPGWIQFRKTLDGEFLTELPVREGDRKCVDCASTFVPTNEDPCRSCGWITGPGIRTNWTKGDWA